MGRKLTAYIIHEAGSPDDEHSIIELSATERWLLAVITAHCPEERGQTQTIQITHEKLAAKTGMSTATIIRTEEKLERRGILIIERQHRHVNTYTTKIHLPKRYFQHHQKKI